MATYYLDASAAGKGYVAEWGSERVLRLLEGDAEHELYLSRLGMVEIASAIFGKVKAGETRSDSALQRYWTGRSPGGMEPSLERSRGGNRCRQAWHSEEQEAHRVNLTATRY